MVRTLFPWRAEPEPMNWLKSTMEVPFQVIAVLLLIMRRSRNRIARFMNRPKVKLLYQAAIMATTLAWLVIWLFAGGENGQRLNDAVRELWGGFAQKTEGPPPP